MPRTYYKATPSNTGAALDVSFNSKATNTKGRPDPKFFLTVTKQNGWDAQSRNGEGNGIFKDGEKTSYAFNLVEISDLVNTLERRIPMENVDGKMTNGDNFHFFHTSAKGSSNGRACFWEKIPKTSNEKYKCGYGFTFFKDKKEFKVSLSFAEGLELVNWLRFGLEHCYSAIYADDKKRAEEYQDKMQNDRGNDRGNEQQAPTNDKPKVSKIAKPAAPRTQKQEKPVKSAVVPEPQQDNAQNDGQDEFLGGQNNDGADLNDVDF